jgi:YegS/Rv2252/BmrU family lipid kinase
MKKKVLLIGNPIAGRGNSEQLIEQFVHVQEQKGYDVEAFLTESRGDAQRRARRIESDVGILVVAGGDGTLNEVINGLPDPSKTPIGLLPLGTANILAHELALPKDPEGVAQAIDGGSTRRIDMGVVGDHRFLMLLSAGLDAMVTEEVRRSRGNRLGYGGYLLPIFKVFLRYRVPHLRVTVDEGEVFEGGLTVVSNTKNYGGIFTVADRARCDSGHFDIVIFPKATVPALVRHAFAARFGRVSKEPDVTYLTGKRVRIESPKPVPIQIDGDHHGTTPVVVDLVPKAVPIVVPSGVPLEKSGPERTYD